VLLPSALKKAEDVEMVEMVTEKMPGVKVVAGVTSDLKSDAEEAVSDVLLGEAMMPGIPADTILDCPC
jgi:hypothetical protein